MRNFYFFTSQKLTAKDSFDALSKEIKNIKMNGENDIMIDSKSRSFITFRNGSPDDFLFDTQEELESFKNKIPFQNPYVTDFETHRSVDLKRVISVLMKIRPEMYIYDDGDFLASAKEYLDTEFDY